MPDAEAAFGDGSAPDGKLPSFAMYVAETGDAEIVGCVEIRWGGSDPGCAWLDRLAVAAHWHRKGVARLLVDCAIAEFSAMVVKGASFDSILRMPSAASPCVLRLTATTVDVAAREAAVAFWHAMGFAEREDTERKQIGTSTAPLALIALHKDVLLPPTSSAPSAEYCAANTIVGSVVVAGVILAWLAGGKRARQC